MLKNLLILGAAAYLIGKALDKRSDAKASLSVEPSVPPLNPALPLEWAARVRGD